MVVNISYDLLTTINLGEFPKIVRANSKVINGSYDPYCPTKMLYSKIKHYISLNIFPAGGEKIFSFKLEIKVWSRLQCFCHGSNPDCWFTAPNAVSTDLKGNSSTPKLVVGGTASLHVPNVN